MTDARMKSFFDKMVRAGVVKPIDRLCARPTRCSSSTSGSGIELRPKELSDPASLSRSVCADACCTHRLSTESATAVGKPIVALTASARRSRTASWRSTARPRGSRRRVSLAARSFRLRQVDGAAHHRRAERADRGRGRSGHGAGSDSDTAAQRIGFVFQEPTLMPWATVAANVRLPLELARAFDAADDASAARRRGARARRACGLRAGLSARTFRRHEDARLDRARAGHRAEAAADGRAVRGARRDHALQAQQRSARALAERSARPWCSSPIRCSSRSISRAASW